MSIFWTLISLFAGLTYVIKNNLTFVDCTDKIFIKIVLENYIRLAKALLNNILQDLINKILKALTVN